nr:DEAD/DEAH box helicase [Candidatus Paceibacterota bacterium]
YALTGTPILNRPIELFNILKAVDHPLGKIRSAYSRRYCGAYLKTIIRRYGPPIVFLDESGATNLNELREKIKGIFLRRKKDDVLDLPEKIIGIMACEMDDEWQAKYDTAWDRYIQFLEENPAPDKDLENIIMARQLVEIQKLKQVCSQSKIKHISEFIENAVEQEEKVIVFSQYTETIGLLGGRMSELGIVFETLVGSDSTEKRQKSIDRFQNDKDCMVFISNIKAGGIGINLTAGSFVVFADMEWSPEIHKQAEDRAHRIGQTGTVNVYYFITKDTIEEDILEILNSKKGVLDQVIDGRNDRIEKSNVYDEFLKRMAVKALGTNALD